MATAYLTNRKVCVCQGRSYSNTVLTKVGLPQGAILSPTLFNVMLSDLPVMDDVHLLGYADDLTICIIDRESHRLQQKLQIYIDEISSWLTENGLKLNPTKSKMQVFTRKRNTTVSIKLQENEVTIVQEQKVLGVIFDAPHLTWKKHMEYVLVDCRRRADILRSLSSTTWGAAYKQLRVF
jgi:hypothetical protein